MDTIATMHFNAFPVNDDAIALEISVTGLHGGHSGDEIHKGFGNSVKIMNRLLWHISNQSKISLANFDGGNLRNAIPRESFSTIVTDKTNREFITIRINTSPVRSSASDTSWTRDQINRKICS